jgi:hypothetical protein
MLPVIAPFLAPHSVSTRPRLLLFLRLTNTISPVDYGLCATSRHFVTRSVALIVPRVRLEGYEAPSLSSLSSSKCVFDL